MAPKKRSSRRGQSGNVARGNAGKPKKVPELEKLASKEVGKRGSPLTFVTVEGVVRAVFTQESDGATAIDFAQTLPRDSDVRVEDHTGEVWMNAEASRRQGE